MGHQFVCLLEVLAGEQRGVVVISTEFTYDKQALGEELLAFFRTKEREGGTKGNSVKTTHQHSRNEMEFYFKKERKKKR